MDSHICSSWRKDEDGEFCTFCGFERECPEEVSPEEIVITEEQFANEHVCSQFDDGGDGCYYCSECGRRDEKRNPPPSSLFL